MHRILLPLFALVFVVACTGKKSEYDLNIPDVAEVNRTARHAVITGTRLLLDLPEGWVQDPVNVRVVKDSATFVQVLDGPGTNYLARKEELIKGYEAQKKAGRRMHYSKNFRLGGYDAFLVYATGSEPAKEELMLVFGDSSFVTLLIAQLRKDDRTARDQLRRLFLSADIDKNIVPDEGLVTRFTLDLGDSGFRFLQRVSQVFIYTPGGRGDLGADPTLDHILVMTLPPMSEADRKKHAANVIASFGSGGLQIRETGRRTISIGGLSALEYRGRGEQSGNPLQVYLAVLGDERATIVFSGIAFRNHDTLMRRYERIAGTLRLK